jgi:anti-sigma factor RsiW
MTELSDDLLVAYVDGQLARKQTRAVEKVLDQDDVIAARVEALKQAHNRLEAAFEAILAGEEMDVSAVSVPVQERSLRERSVVKVALAGVGIAVALILAAVGYGWPLAFPGLTPGTQGVTLPVQTAPMAIGWHPDLVAFQLSQVLGTDIKLPNLEPQGFRFVRAQALRSGGEPLTQILYLGSSGAPLALYAKKGEGSGTLIPNHYGAIGTVAWAEDGVAYLLAGEAEDSLLMRIATKIKLEPAPPLRSAPQAQTPVNGALNR